MPGRAHPADRRDALLLPRMTPLIATLILAVGVALFGVSVIYRVALWRHLRPNPPREGASLGPSLWRVLRFGFLQHRVWRHPFVGAAHLVIMWGFFALLANTIVLWGRYFHPDFDLPFFADTVARGGLRVASHIASALVLAAALAVLGHRLVLRPARLKNNRDGLLIPLLIAAMMACDLLYWLLHIEWARSAHALAVLVFLNYLPFSKHFHVLCAWPQLYAARPETATVLSRDAAIEAALAPDAHDGDNGDSRGDIPEDSATFGAGTWADLTRRDALEALSCTECGRCTERCPAAQAGKALRPGDAMMAMHHAAHHGVQHTALLPQVLGEAALWDCTTCRACEAECPLLITFVDRFVRMRRHQVEERGQLPPELARTLRALESTGNPWGLPPTSRTDWTSGLSVPRFDAAQHEYLLFVGCAGSCDPAAIPATAALVHLLTHAGVRFGTLGDDETCCGDVARRLGAESTFLTMSQQLMARLCEANARRIITVCPHCLHMLASEYTSFGAHFEVVHHSVLLAALIDEGRLVPKAGAAIDASRIAFHDPCYAARYQDIVAAPRRVLQAIGGLSLCEAALSGDQTHCCGAGGGSSYRDAPKGERLQERRYHDLAQTGATQVGTACPWCLAMFADAHTNAPEALGAAPVDIAQLLWRAIQP